MPNRLLMNRDRGAVRNFLTAALTDYVSKFKFHQFEPYYSAKMVYYRSPEQAKTLALSMVASVTEQLLNSTDDLPSSYCASGHLHFSAEVQNSHNGSLDLRMAIEWVVHASGTSWVQIP
jgi:putative salt-induced outer membrane protein YdiY